MIHYRHERRLLALLTAFFFASWLLPCITDVNHPPGTRLVRIAAAVAALGVLWLEAARPWCGFYLFLVLWPHALIIRELLCRQSELWLQMPIFWSGPLASSLALAYGWRLERASRRRQTDVPLAPAESAVPWRKWIGAFRIALWLLVVSWLLSMVCSLLRLRAWEAMPLSCRLLLSQPQISPLTPFLSTAAVLPSLLLGLLLLNGLSDLALDGATELVARPLQPKAFQMLLCLLGLLLAAQLCVQVSTGWTWKFDEGPPSGPFPNRNTAAPLLVILGASFFSLVGTSQGLKKLALLCLGLVVALCACLTASRNGLFLLLILPLLALLPRPTWRRTVLACLLFVFGVTAALFAPLPGRNGTQSELWQRVAATRQALRDWDWHEFSSGRTDVFRSALTISGKFPLAGSGPGTFMRETQPTPRLKLGDMRGEFTVTRCQDEKGRFLEVRLVKPPAAGLALIELQHELALPARPGHTFELRATACISRGSTGSLFYQDQTAAGWHRTSWKVTAEKWERVQGTGAVRVGILVANAGVSFAPQSAAEYLRLRELSFLQDDFSDWLGPDRVSAQQLSATAGPPNDTLYAAHSMPLNLLAEIGPLGMLAWVGVWIVLPAIALVRWRRGNLAALALLLAGVANIFDTVWLCSGATTFFVLLVVLACWECREAYGLESTRGAAP